MHALSSKHSAAETRQHSLPSANLKGASGCMQAATARPPQHHPLLPAWLRAAAPSRGRNCPAALTTSAPSACMWVAISCAGWLLVYLLAGELANAMAWNTLFLLLPWARREGARAAAGACAGFLRCCAPCVAAAGTGAAASRFKASAHAVTSPLGWRLPSLSPSLPYLRLYLPFSPFHRLSGGCALGDRAPCGRDGFPAEIGRHSLCL